MIQGTVLHRSSISFSTVNSCQSNFLFSRFYHFVWWIRFLGIQKWSIICMRYNLHTFSRKCWHVVIYIFSHSQLPVPSFLSSKRRATAPSLPSACQPSSRLPSGPTLSASFTMKSPRTADSPTQSAKLQVYSVFVIWLFYRGETNLMTYLLNNININYTSCISFHLK